ncbi:MAG: glycoside hydrolase family 78 protein [Dysgonamonadaceae bacterium]|nr:glycoside hydrolase family 78 protein [Dysgonamonadaceae bacterium]
MKRLIIRFSWILLLALKAHALPAAAGVQVAELKCGYAVNPLGIDDAHPLLSWHLLSDRRGTLQQAYQILVATSPEKLTEDAADAWNSGFVISTQSAGIKYDGGELQSRQRYYWKVRIRTDGGTASGWSAPAWFETALLHPSDWQGEWITYAAGMPGRVLYFKTIWNKDKPIKQARMYIAGLGFYELHINGKKVGENVLDPAQSTYSKRIYYATYDVTDRLTEESNVIVATVAPGWYGVPSLLAQMEIVDTDGNRQTLNSDWFRHVIPGPTLYSTVFDGESYDARLESPKINGLEIAPMMDKDWAWAYNTADPGNRMETTKADPIQIMDTIVPATIKELKTGVYVIDAGRNLAGWAEIKVKGKEGTKISLKFSETLYADGTVNQENLRNAKVTDTYILSGKDTMEIWHPAFTYHGFRYVQIEGFPYKPAVGDITIQTVRSSMPITGKFNCSNKLLNDIHRMVVNTEASNLHSVPTDCPQRDERMGWLNDLTVRIEQAIYNFDMSRFYPKFIADVSDTQDEQGRITCVAPFRFGMRPADPVCASYLLLAYQSYKFYGNAQVIADHFSGMKAWTDYLYSRTRNGIVDYSYYGDWCPPIEFGLDKSPISRDTPGKMISTGYLYYCAKILSEMAAVIGKDAEAAKYRRLSEEIAVAFNREYWDETTGGYASNNQASNSFALYMGLVKPENVKRVAENIAKDVEKHDFHLTTGNLCTKYLLETLTEYGYPETAYRIATQTSYPSWGFMLSKGATTLWERWEYATGGDMNSHNHPMMGSVGSWFYKYAIGINPDFAYPGFERFVIKPYIFNDLTFVEGELNTVKGLIKSVWKKQGDKLMLNVSVPGNTIAELYIPAQSEKSITESGRSALKAKGLKFIRMDEGYAVFEAGSGEYSFRNIMPNPSLLVH